MAELDDQTGGDTAEQRQFVDLAWTLYRGDENWIPPLRRNLEELVGFRKHPFHDVADVRTWLAWRDGQAVGRITGIINHTHNAEVRREARLLRVLRVGRRPGGGQRVVRRRPRLAGRAGDHGPARAGQPVAELRDRAC